jgi:hypothetical protein
LSFQTESKRNGNDFDFDLGVVAETGVQDFGWGGIDSYYDNVSFWRY